MNKWISTKESKWVTKWNDIVLNDPNSVFLQSSFRVSTYLKQGMDWELLLCIDENNNILLGSANVIVKLSIFKIYVCSYGPTINLNNNKYFDDYISHFINRAKELKAFSSQISMTLNASVDSKYNSIDKKLFTNITSPQFKNLISLKEDKVYLSNEDLIGSFKSKCRRDVRSSYRKGLTSKFPTLEDELRIAYSCIELNAKIKGYNVRSWNQMKDFLINSVESNRTYVITAWINDKIEGAILLERSYDTLSYTMGGVYRSNPDLLTGYFLQFEAMLLAKRLDLGQYDISYGGPTQVQRFKKMFNPILSENYKNLHFIHTNWKYLIFKKLYDNMKNIILKIIKLKDNLTK